MRSGGCSDLARSRKQRHKESNGSKFAFARRRIAGDMGWLLRMLHLDARDAAARDPLDGEFRAAVFDGVALIQQPSGARDQESGHCRVVVGFGQFQAEFAVGLADGHSGVDAEDAFAALTEFRGQRLVVFVLDLADDLFEYVFKRQDALDAAVFVDDYGQVDAALLQALKDVSEPGRVGNEDRLAHDLFQVEYALIEQEGHDVLAVEPADYLVEIPAVDWQARIARDLELAHDLFETGALFERHDLGARDHNFARGQVGEFEDVVDHLTLFLLQLARLMADIDQAPEFFFRVDGVMARPEIDAEELEKFDARNVDQPDEGFESLVEKLHPTGRRQRDGFGLLDGQGLRRVFAQHKVQIGDHGQRDGDGYRMRDQRRRRRREKVQQGRLEEMGERRFAYRAEREACDGDAELAGGEHCVEPVQRAQHCSGPALFRRRQSLYLRAADADQRELHRHEEPVCQHQNQNGKYFEEYPKHRRRGIIAYRPSGAATGSGAAPLCQPRMKAKQLCGISERFHCSLF